MEECSPPQRPVARLATSLLCRRAQTCDWLWTRRKALDGVRQTITRSGVLLKSCGKRLREARAAAATSEATSFVLAGWAAELHPAARGLRGAQRGVADAPPLRRDR